VPGVIHRDTRPGGGYVPGVAGDRERTSWARLTDPLTSLLLVAALLGLGLRVWMIVGPFARLDVDEAIVGLMARNASRGKFCAFFWGQDYGGTQEQLLAAPVVALAGARQWALRLVPVALTAVASWLVWRVGRRTVGEPAARLAAIVFWIFPGVYVWWSIKPRGFYEAQIVIGLAVLLLSLQLVEHPSTRKAALLGFTIGLGIWASPHIAYFALPAMLWLLLRNWRLLRYAGVAAGATILGALPWLYHNVGSGGRSLDAGHTTSSYVDNLQAFFRTSLPVTLGLRQATPAGLSASITTAHSEWIVPGLAVVAYVVLLGAFVWLCIRRPAGTELPILVAALFPLIYAAQPFQPFASTEPRYVFFLAPIVSLLLARAFVALRLHVAGVVLFGVLSVTGSLSFVHLAERAPRDLFTPWNLSPLVAVLDRYHVRDVFAPYNFAYRLTFMAQERVIATPIEGIGTRYPPYRSLVRKSASPAYAFVRDGPGDRYFAPTLASKHVGFRRYDAGRYVLYILDRRVMPEELPGLGALGMGLM
jgi:dolichyl-phosphate-mannose-protein mannosyltransferase